MGSIALNYALQILLNSYCNDQMNHNDGNCCSDPESVTNIQIITFVFFAVCGTLVLFIFLHRRFTSTKVRWHPLINEYEEYDHHVRIQRADEKKSYRELLFSLSKFGLLMAYFFLCDKTNFFMKENKYYTSTSFFLPLAYVFSLGLFFTEESRHTCVLHRDQTDEWKGWMQLVLLIYHMTGASQVLPIYILIRIIVAAYLFLSGYGHFSYFGTQAISVCIEFER